MKVLGPWESALLMAPHACIELSLPLTNKHKMRFLINKHQKREEKPNYEPFAYLTWCTVHVGDGIFVTALLHVTPATEVGNLNVTYQRKEKTASVELKINSLNLGHSQVSLPALFKLFTHL